MHLSYKGKMLGKLTSKKLMQWMKMVVTSDKDDDDKTN